MNHTDKTKHKSSQTTLSPLAMLWAFGVILVSGTSSYANDAYDPYAAFEDEDTYSLSVIAYPADSMVQIMNIRPDYEDGMLLPNGKYDVLVSSPGYISTRKIIEIKDNDISVKIRLMRERFFYKLWNSFVANYRNGKYPEAMRDINDLGEILDVYADTVRDAMGGGEYSRKRDLMDKGWRQSSPPIGGRNSRRARPEHYFP